MTLKELLILIIVLLVVVSCGPQEQKLEDHVAGSSEDEIEISEGLDDLGELDNLEDELGDISFDDLEDLEFD